MCVSMLVLHKRKGAHALRFTISMHNELDPYSVGFTIIRLNDICMQRKKKLPVFKHSPDWRSVLWAWCCVRRNTWKSTKIVHRTKVDKGKRAKHWNGGDYSTVRSLHYTAGNRPLNEKSSLLCKSFGWILVQCFALIHMALEWGKKKLKNKVEKGAFCIAMCMLYISIHSPYAPNRTKIFTGYSRYWAIVHNRLYCDEGFHSVDNFQQVNIRAQQQRKLRSNFIKRKVFYMIEK